MSVVYVLLYSKCQGAFHIEDLISYKSNKPNGYVPIARSLDRDYLITQMGKYEL